MFHKAESKFVFVLWKERGSFKFFSVCIWTFEIKRQRKDKMSVSPCNLVNSVIMRNMEILIKMSFLMVIILTAIMIIVFYCFQMSLYICKGQCRSLSRTHKFQTLSNNILKHFSIKALVLVLSWHSLDKNDIDLRLQ